MYLVCVMRTEEGESVGIITLAPKTFNSGKPGYFGQAKLTIGGRRHQVQVQAVRIGQPEEGNDDGE